MSPLVIAHRGASTEAPENTLLAFARALELGVDGIELDVQVTRDGVPVVFHDSNLIRLTGTRGRLANRTWSELQKLRVGGEPIPTLADALSLTRKRCILQIEIKKGTPVAPVLAAIRKTASAANVILASFEHDILREAATLAPKLPRMLIVDRPKTPMQFYTKVAKIANLSRAQAPIRFNTEVAESAEGAHVGKAVIHHSAFGIRHSPLAMHLVQAMVSAGASGLSVEHRAAASPLFVETIHRHGAQLWCWTVNDASAMRRLSRYSVDAILTDDPAKLLKVLRT
jgi:glycerophosphoryl diester phosphodiesterase